MPRKIAGREISTIDESRVAMNIPNVVLERTIHVVFVGRIGGGRVAGRLCTGQNAHRKRLAKT